MTGAADNGGVGAGADTGNDQLPVLCRRCGGPVDPDAHLRLACRYCGLDDQLPAEIHERTRELRQRLRAAARTAAQLDGLQRSLAGLFEDPRTMLRALVPIVVPVAAILIFQAASGLMAMQKVPAALRSAETTGAMAGAMVSGGVMITLMPLAMVGGMLASRWSYRRRLRPLLLGRPPRQPGRPARCRSCGGELGDGRGPFVPCRYCATPNLLSPELQKDSARLLAAEEEQLRGQSRRALGAGARTSHNLGRVVAVAGAVMYVGMIALAGTLQKFVQLAFR